MIMTTRALGRYLAVCVAALVLAGCSAATVLNVLTPTGAPTKGDRRNKYKFRLVAERLLQQSMDDRYESYWMRRAKELEPQARTSFVGFLSNCGGIEEVGREIDDVVGASVGDNRHRSLARHADAPVTYPGGRRP